jgi:hypothetical protein
MRLLQQRSACASQYTVAQQLIDGPLTYLVFLLQRLACLTILRITLAGAAAVLSVHRSEYNQGLIQRAPFSSC